VLELAALELTNEERGDDIEDPIGLSVLLHCADDGPFDGCVGWHQIQHQVGIHVLLFVK
jgi:hypothetical protein